MVSTLTWVLTGIAAAGFTMTGAMKLFAFEKLVENAPNMANVGKTNAQLLGAAELLGAAGLVLPIALGVIPILSGFAALGLAIIGCSAFVAHIRWKEAVNGLFPLVLAGLSVAIAIHHFS